MNRIGICMSIWKRHRITEIVLDYYKELKKELRGKIEIEVFVVGSEGEKSRKMVESRGFVYKEFPNEPLSEKQNQRLLLAKDWKPDGLVMTGSDDLIAKKVFMEYNSFLNSQEDKMQLVGFSDMYFYVNCTVRYLWGYGSKVKNRTVGAGRLYTKEVLDTVGWTLWDRPKNRGLDYVAFLKLQQFEIPVKILRLTQLKTYILGLDCKEGLSAKSGRRLRLPSTPLKVERMFKIKL
jgi:hypothetical protein